MKDKILKFSSLLCLMIFLSCGSSDVQRSMTSVLRPATDVPDRFESPEGVTRGENACLSPLTDPRDGTQIILRTAFAEEGVGDYVVPSGLYGVGSRELLRINCRTGEVLGIVRR